MSITVPTDNDRWPAELHLRFARDKKRSVLIENRHAGPLVVQKAIYPEGEQICHVVVVHPPGGMAGGDELTLEIDLAANSSAVISTPGAAKWYKAPRRTCRQKTTIRLEKGSTLDWLPQENIF
jgi:urease accessory protein